MLQVGENAGRIAFDRMSMFLKYLAVLSMSPQATSSDYAVNMLLAKSDYYVRYPIPYFRLSVVIINWSFVSSESSDTLKHAVLDIALGQAWSCFGSRPM